MILGKDGIVKVIGYGVTGKGDKIFKELDSTNMREPI